MEKSRIGRAGQVRIYVGKCLRLFVSEKQWINFISTAIIMCIIALVTGEDMFVAYSDTKNGAFAIICACIWIGLFNSIRSVCRERDIIKWEHKTGLHISSYVIAHVVYELLLCVVETLIVITVVFLKYHENIPVEGLIFPMLLDLYVTLLLVMFGSDMLALLISCMVKSENTAMTVMPFVLIIQLVMSGAVFSLSGITERMAYLTLSKWGLNAICSISNTIDSVYEDYEIFGNGDCAATAEHLGFIWLLLLGYALIYIVLGVVALEQVDRDKR